MNKADIDIFKEVTCLEIYIENKANCGGMRCRTRIVALSAQPVIRLDL
jgi:hypothetical protein